MAVLDRTPDAATLGRIERRWLDAPGIPGFFTTVDHKRIGIRYIYTSFVFFFLAGVQALIMRVQLSAPNADVVGANVYNEGLKDSRQILGDEKTASTVKNVKKALSVSDRACVLELGRIHLADRASTLIGDERVARLYMGMSGTS